MSFLPGVWDPHPDSCTHSQPDPCSSLFISTLPECPPPATHSASSQAHTSLQPCSHTTCPLTHINSYTHACSPPFYWVVMGAGLAGLRMKTLGPGLRCEFTHPLLTPSE